MTNQTDTPHEVGESTLAGEADSNAALSAMNPILYGALLSYAVYSIAEIVTAAEARVPGLSWPEAAQRLMVAGAMLMFLIKDIGEVFKIDRECPYRRVTRYVFEVLTVLFYAVSFGLIRVGSYFAVISYGVALGLGGLWSNSLRVERKADPTNIATFAKVLRGLHYLGAPLCGLQVATFSILGPPRELSFARAATFGVVLFSWLVLYEFEVNYRCGPYTGYYTVNYVVTPRRLARRKERRRIRAAAAEARRAAAEAQRQSEYIRPTNKTL